MPTISLSFAKCVSEPTQAFHQAETVEQIEIVDWIHRLVGTVAGLLWVSTRPIQVRVVDEPSWLAQTQMAHPTEVPQITISKDLLLSGVVAHELTHCLVPTPWLFAAEGLATYVGCKIAGTCEDFFFSEPTLEAVLTRHWHGSPSLIELVVEEVGKGNYLGPGRFHRLDGRLAHILAGSIYEFWLGICPSIAAETGVVSAPSPTELIIQTWCSLSGLEEAWEKWRRERARRWEGSG